MAVFMTDLIKALAEEIAQRGDRKLVVDCGEIHLEVESVEFHTSPYHAPANSAVLVLRTYDP